MLFVNDNAREGPGNKTKVFSTKRFNNGRTIAEGVLHYFRYPSAEKNTLEDISLFCTLNSRVAVLGPNGAGKSTMIKVLTGETEPTTGTVWKHPNMRIAYVAQHAFHHIEQVCSLISLACVSACCCGCISALPPLMHL